MVSRIATVAFSGIDVTDIDVQVQVSSGLVAFNIVGLPAKAVAESRERVRAAFHAMGLSFPAKRITVNLAPADVIKEGSHFDLPIALALLGATDVLPRDLLRNYSALGELGLDGSLAKVSGVLPAAMNANGRGLGLICPAQCGGEAAWAAEELDILAPKHLLNLVNHFKGTQHLPQPTRPKLEDSAYSGPDMKDIRGQQAAKRVLEIAAAGGHHLLLIGPPGAGKSMLASRLPGILPPLSPEEALEVSTIHSVAGMLEEGRLITHRPYRDPHHSASLPALVGGGQKAGPGEISLAHCGVLFLDELPEFNRQTLESLRQPLETGKITIARANHHITYPAQLQMIAAMNPCRCGHLADPALACTRAPKCAVDYQSKISGPLFDRMDLVFEVGAVDIKDMHAPPSGESTAEVAARVLEVRRKQWRRYKDFPKKSTLRTNARLDGELLTQFADPVPEAKQILYDAAEKMKLSGRGYNRILRVARTIADLAGAELVQKPHVMEALAYRRVAYK